MSGQVSTTYVPARQLGSRGMGSRAVTPALSRTTPSFMYLRHDDSPAWVLSVTFAPSRILASSSAIRRYSQSSLGGQSSGPLRAFWRRSLLAGDSPAPTLNSSLRLPSPQAKLFSSHAALPLVNHPVSPVPNPTAFTWAALSPLPRTAAVHARPSLLISFNFWSWLGDASYSIFATHPQPTRSGSQNTVQAASTSA